MTDSGYTLYAGFSSACYHSVPCSMSWLWCSVPRNRTNGFSFNLVISFCVPGHLCSETVLSWRIFLVIIQTISWPGVYFPRNISYGILQGRADSLYHSIVSFVNLLTCLYNVTYTLCSDDLMYSSFSCYYKKTAIMIYYHFEYPRYSQMVPIYPGLINLFFLDLTVW